MRVNVLAIVVAGLVVAGVAASGSVQAEEAQAGAANAPPAEAGNPSSVVRFTFQGISLLVAPKKDGAIEGSVHVLLPRIGGESQVDDPAALRVAEPHEALLRYCPVGERCRDLVLDADQVRFEIDGAGLVNDAIVLHRKDIGDRSLPLCFPGRMGCSDEQARSLRWLPDLDDLAVKTLGEGARLDETLLTEPAPSRLAGRFEFDRGEVFVSGFWPTIVVFAPFGGSMTDPVALASSFSVEFEYRGELTVVLENWNGGDSRTIPITPHPFVEIVVTNQPVSHHPSAAAAGEDPMDEVDPSSGHFIAHYRLWEPPPLATAAQAAILPHVPQPTGGGATGGNPQCSPGESGGG